MPHEKVGMVETVASPFTTEVIVKAAGPFPVAAAVTVRTVVPETPANLAVIVAVPTALAVARPLVSIVATVSSEELQTTVILLLDESE